MEKDIQQLPLVNTRDRSTGHWEESCLLLIPSPTSKSKLEAGSVYFGPARGRSMICKVDLLLPCLPWQPLRAGHWLLPQMSTVRSHNHTRTHTPTRMSGSYSVTLSFCHCGLPLLISEHPQLALIIAPGEVLLLYYIICFLSLLAPGTVRDGRRFLPLFSEEVHL